jgi:hypothetical protein
VVKQEITTAELVRQLVEVREERRKISARDKELVEKWRSLEMEALIRLDEQGMEKVTTPSGTAGITETILPQVVDWDAFYAYMQETDSLYLLQRRPAAAAFRELNSSGTEIPGVTPYTQRAISLRKK